MDPLKVAKLHHAAMTINQSIRGHYQQEKANAFLEIVRAAALDVLDCTKGGDGGEFRRILASSTNSVVTASLVEKAAALSRTDLNDGPLEELAAAFVASFAAGSLLDAILRYAVELPHDAKACMIASASTADQIQEGGLKVVRKPGLSVLGIEPLTAAALTAFTAQSVRGSVGLRIIEVELRKAVLRAINAMVIESIVDSNTTTISQPTTLQDALAEAGAGTAYVVAASPTMVASLALTDANKAGLGVAGGDLVPGLSVVPVDGLAADELIIIPADRLAIRAWPLRVQASTSATLNMSDTPEGPSEVVSMFQTNSIAIIAERMFLIGGDFSGVVHVLPQSEV